MKQPRVLYLYVGEHIKPKQPCGADTFYSATITLVPPVTLVLHGLLPLHSLYNIHVLLHNIWHPLSFEQIPLIQIYQINHTLIKTINLQLFLSPWKTLRLFTMIHSHNNNYSLFFHTQNYFVCFFHLLKFCGLKIIAAHFNKLNNLKLVDFNIHNFKCSYTMWKHF